MSGPVPREWRWWPASLGDAVHGRRGDRVLGRGPEEWLDAVLDFYDDIGAQLRDGTIRLKGWTPDEVSEVVAELDRLTCRTRGFREYLEYRRDSGDLPEDFPGFDGLVGDLAEAAIMGLALGVLGSRVGAEPFVKLASVGARVTDGGSKGARRELDAETCQQWLDAEARRDPAASWAELRRRAGRKFYFGEKVIRNRCTPPKGVKHRPRAK